MILWAIRSCIDRLVYRCSPAAREALAARREVANRRRVQDVFDACERSAQVVFDACDICSGRTRYLCAICREPIKLHSHENDFMCETHGDVNAIRESDGAVLAGDGVCGQPRVVA